MSTEQFVGVAVTALLSGMVIALVQLIAFAYGYGKLSQRVTGTENWQDDHEQYAHGQPRPMRRRK